MAVQAQFYSENSGLPICFQDWPSIPVRGIDNGLVLGLPYSPQQSHFQPHNQNNQSFCIDCTQRASSSSTCNSFPSMALSQSLSAQLELQSHEIDCILLSQNEKLRHTLQNQRNEQVAILLSSLESKSLSLIRQKEEDLAQATKKTIQLEDHLRKAELESEAWQRLAKENEAMVANLSNTLEEVRERMVLVSNKGEDTESCYGPNERGGRKEEEMESIRKRMACKSCNSKSSCLVFLPCRHLCCCYFCEALLDFCPVCKSAKEGCMEVFLA